VSAYLSSLSAVVRHPAALTACGVGFAAFLYLSLKAKRLSRIVNHLASLPAGQRRYVLEREYRIHPGADHTPLGFLRRRRSRLRVAAAAALWLPALGVFGASVRLWNNARAIGWELHDPAPTLAGRGFAWDVEFRNRSGETIEIGPVELEIEATGDAAAQAPATPSRQPHLTEGRQILVLDDEARKVSVIPPEAPLSIPPRSVKRLALYLDTPGGAWQRRAFSLRLTVRWAAPGKTAVLTRRGRSHVVAWPLEDARPPQGVSVEPAPGAGTRPGRNANENP